MDWSAAHRKLENLHALCYRMENLGQGGFRFTCLLATNQAGQTHHVEADANNEAEAVRLALNQAEKWASGGK